MTIPIVCIAAAYVLSTAMAGITTDRRITRRVARALTVATSIAAGVFVGAWITDYANHPPFTAPQTRIETK